jgi:hypothetical protein
MQGMSLLLLGPSQFALELKEQVPQWVILTVKKTCSKNVLGWLAAIAKLSSN